MNHNGLGSPDRLCLGFRMVPTFPSPQESWYDLLLIAANYSLQRTVAPVTACADRRPPTRAHAAPGPSLRSGTLRPLNSRR